MIHENKIKLKNENKLKVINENNIMYHDKHKCIMITKMNKIRGEIKSIMHTEKL